MLIDQFVKSAIDIHCHGVGNFDFTEIQSINFQEVEDILAKRGIHTILTLYLYQSRFDDFLEKMEEFYQAKASGQYKHIVGIGLEGPLLASFGGTPSDAVWNPSKQQWQQLSSCGKQGLVYVIYSPDFPLNPQERTSLDAPANNVTWIAETLLSGGVLPSAGHFLKDNPFESARLLQSVYDVVKYWGCGPTLTDHLYNDMPRNFKHAWRTELEKQNRDQDILIMNMNDWNLDNIEEKLGIVPATIIKNAINGLVKVALNFDGEHVDLAIVKKTVDFMGAENMVMMTDSIESGRLAGRHLHFHGNSTLFYQDNEIVAAGSQGVQRQIENMINIGLTKKQIQLITHDVPSKLLNIEKHVYAETSYF